MTPILIKVANDAVRKAVVTITFVIDKFELPGNRANYNSVTVSYECS